MALREARDEDWEGITGSTAPAEWRGYVEASDWLVEGLGAIYRGTDQRWWITVVRLPLVRKVKTAHACAKKLLDWAKREGVSVHAIPDPRKDGSELWLQRLGFTPTDDRLGGLTVWKSEP